MSQALPFGRARSPDGAQIKTALTQQLTIGASPVLASALFNSSVIAEIKVNSPGTLYLSRVGDFDGTTQWYYPYTVTAGAVLQGNFAAIGGTAQGSTSGLSLTVSS